MSISTIIPFVNNEETLDRAIRSVLELAGCTELVLIDDGSTDGSKIIAAKWISIDTRVKLLHTGGDSPKGAGYSRNFGIYHATSIWITFLDADDIYCKNRYEHILNINDDSIDYILEPILITNLNSQVKIYEKETHNNLLSIHNSIKENKQLFDSVLRGSITRNGIHINSISIKKKYLITNNLYFDETLEIGQDTYWKLQLFLNGKFIIYSEHPVAVYHSGPENRSNKNEKLKYKCRARYSNLLLKKIIRNRNINLRSKLFLLRFYLENKILHRHPKSKGLPKIFLKTRYAFNFFASFFKK